ncbi:MAG TPA: MBL fold metallo-hydrolase [Nitrospiraceae bacterium]|jgi:glyoxylase-like metal-dependent hydrolase (beta-lactamase superfamily II)|nr:MBL fold metallo-hydrolase [Nitrospiraceae bacterium]
MRTLPQLLTGLLCIGMLLDPGAVSAQEAKPIDELTKLAEDVFLFRHKAHQGLVVVTADGVIATDPISVEAATWLKAELKKLTAKPVRYVIYSHDHADHIAGGTVFADTAVFVSHWRARQDLLEKKPVETPLPELTFTDRLFIDLGGKHVEAIHVGRNHSDNSVVVLLPRERVLFAVDFIPVEAVAYRRMRDSYPEEWIESLKRVEQLDFDVLAPGHGPVGRKEHVRMFREYLEDLMREVRQAVLNGMSLEEAKQTIRLPKYEQWNGYPDWFLENIEAMYQYLSVH